jgi:hypothetical protein
MAFRADKNTLRVRDALVSQLSEKRAELDKALEAYNEQIAPLSADLRQAVQDYNTLLFDVRALIEEFATEMQGEFEDKSERWREGDRGQSISEWISELESASDFEDIEFEEPQEIVIDADDHAALLDDLQLEPELA